MDIFTDEELLKIAEGFFERREYNYAIELFSIVISHNDENARAYYLRSFCYSNLKLHDQADQDFNKAFELDPSDPDILLSKAIEAYNDKDYERLKQLATLIPIKSPSIEILLLRFSEYFYFAGMYETSYNLVKGASHSNLERMAWKNLLALKRYDDAAQILRSILRIDETHTEAMVGLAEVMLFQNNYSKSIELFMHDDIENDLKDANYFYHLGLAYLKNKDFTHAIDSFEDALRTDASYLLAYKDLGIALEQQGKRKNALELFQKAKALNYSKWHDGEIDHLIHTFYY